MAVAMNILLNPLEMNLSWNCDRGESGCKGTVRVISDKYLISSEG
jgi:hypothetical protein